MAKTNETEQERNDRDFRNHINEKTKERAESVAAILKESFTKAAAQAEESFAKAVEAAERNRKRKLAREFGCCFFSAVGIAGLYMAQIAGLIAPVLANPVFAFGYIYFGWHLCKIGRFMGCK